MVEAPHKHKSQGLLYNVSIDISVPGADLAVKKEANEDVYIAIRDAFDSARRQLLHYSRRRNKKHMVNSKDYSTMSVSVIDKELERNFLSNIEAVSIYNAESDKVSYNF